MADPRKDPPWFRDRIVLSVIGLILATGLLLTGLLAYLREQTLREGIRLTGAFAAVIDEQTSRTLQAIDLRMERLEQTLAAIGADNKLASSPDPRIQAALEATIDALPFIDNLLLVNADGKVLHSSDPSLGDMDLANRDFVATYRTRPGTQFFIGAPVVGRNGEWLLPMARPWLGGPRPGVVVAHVRVPYFDQLWASLALEADASVGLLRNDGLMLMRSPIDGAAMGRSFSQSPLFLHHLPASRDGHYRVNSTIDGVDRYFAYRSLDQQSNLLVIVGRTADAMLLPWRRLAQLLAGVWAIASLGLLLMSTRLTRQSAQRRRAEVDNAVLVNRLSIASEAAHLSLWEWDVATDTWEVTPTYHTMLGYPPQSGPVTRAQWLARVHPDDHALGLAQAEQIRTQVAAPYDFVFRQRHADGHYCWMRTFGQIAARDAQGKATRVVGIRIDVTDKVQAQHERQQMVERISDALVTLDTDWRITYANERAGVLLDHPVAEMIGQNAWAIFPDSGGFKFREVYQRCMATQKPEVFEEHYAPANVWYESHIYPSPEGLSVYFRDITARKLGEQALRDAKEQAENLINGANVMVVGLNAQGHITIFNKMAQELTGYTLGDLAGRNWFEVLVPRERYPHVHAEFERIAMGGPPLQFENPILTATGEERIIAWQNSVIRDGDTVTGTLSFGLDVTLRRKAERELAESKEQFETLANNSMQGIALVRKGQFAYINPAFCTITGRSAAELQQLPVQRLLDLVHPDDRAGAMDRLLRGSAGEPIAADVEQRILFRPGEWHWVQVATRQITLGGEPALLSMMLDVHDRHLAEEALRASEARFRSAFESSGSGMGLTALDGRWMQVNPALCRIIGYTAQEMCQLTFMEITHADDLALDLALMDELLAGNRPHFSMEKRYLHRDGHPVWVNLTVALVRNDDGEPLYTVAQIEDIDRRKALEVDLYESQANLKATVDALPDMMFEVDLEGTYHSCHTPQAELLVRPATALIGQRVCDVMPPNAAAVIMSALHDAHAKGHSIGQQIQLDMPQGSEWFELSVTHKDTPANQSPRFIVLSRQITERIRAVEALRSSEELMRQMAESVSQLFLLVDLQKQCYLYVSPAAEKVLGHSAQELCADHTVWHHLVHPHDVPAVQDALRRGAQSGVMDIEFRFASTEGAVRWVHVRAYPVLDAQGRPYRSAGVVEDITLRKTLEIREEHEQTMLQYLASSRPLPEILEKFVLSYEALVPDMKASILLLEPDGQHLRHGAAPHLPPAYSAAIDGCAIGPAAGSCGTAAFTGDAVVVSDISTDPRWVDYRDLAARFQLRACWSVPIKGMEGQVLGTFAFYFDHVRAPQAFERQAAEHGAQLASQAIERHLAVQALQRSEARYRNVVQWSPVGIAIVQNQRFVFCNPAVLEIFGAASVDALMAQPSSERIHPDDRPMITQLRRQVIEHSASTDQIEARGLRMDGRVIDLQMRGAPTSMDGEPAIQVVMLDITARKEAEAALRASRQQLRVLSSKVLAAQETERRRVAHELHDELGQSLTAIKINLQSQSLGDARSAADTCAENIRIVEQALQHVRQLALALRPSMLDDLGLMSALRWLTQQVAQRHNMKVSLQVSDGVGRLEPDTETAVFRIVQEALTNIERHAQADTVEVRADMESDHVFVMRIHDNGRGFDVQAAQDLASSGASMGVLGMEERATLIGGNLQFASSPGEGTTITLRCPLVTQVTC